MLLLCKLWPWLAGGLIGWLLSGWLARKLKYGEPPVENIVERKVEVEKVIDNPKHLSLISKLEGENSQIAGLLTTISDYKNRKPEIVEKIVEKLVDNPVHLKRITELENRKPETVEKIVEKIVEKEVVKQVDNPTHLSRIKQLEDEASKRTGEIGDLRSKLMVWENKKPETIEKIVEKEVVKQVDNPAHLKLIGSLEDEIKVWKRGPAINIPAARAAGIEIKKEDDFTAIEGVGPKINDLIHADGIHTFRELSEVEPARIQKILDKAGANFQMAKPGTWPDQANLACNNRWPALKALQDILDGGVYPDASAGSKSDGGSVDNSAEYTARISDLEAELKSYKTGPALNLELAKASGFRISRKGDQDDFTVIEGIGPKINDLIHADGIHTYFELARTDVAVIQKILDKAGSSFELARPATWPDQSDLAAKNRWEVLKSWQDVLDGGKE